MFGKSTKKMIASAAECMTKKAVLCVDNVGTACTTEQMKSFVENMGVKVFTCFEAKSRRCRDDDEDAAYKRKAFRVCICEDHV